MARPRMTVQEKIRSFFSKIHRTKKCWIWCGGSSRGYGHFEMFGEIKAHRVSYILHCNKIPEGKQILHKCDNPICVNPEHLFVGTHKGNMKDMVEKQRSYRKLSDDQIRIVRRAFVRLLPDYKSGEQLRKRLADIFDVHIHTIFQILRYHRRPRVK